MMFSAVWQEVWEGEGHCKSNLGGLDVWSSGSSTAWLHMGSVPAKYTKSQALMKENSPKMLKFRHKKVKSTYRVLSLNYKAEKVV